MTRRVLLMALVAMLFMQTVVALPVAAEESAPEVVPETPTAGAPSQDVSVTAAVVTTPSDAPPVASPDSPPPPALFAPMLTEVQVSGSCVQYNVACSGNAVEFIELYNPNTVPLPLADVAIQYHGSGTTFKPLVDTSALVLAPGQLAVIGNVVGASASLKSTLADGGGSIQMLKNGMVIDQVAWGTSADGFYTKVAVAPPTNQSIQRCFINGTLNNAEARDTSLEFLVYKNELPTPSVALTCPTVETPPPANLCDGLGLSEIAANTDRQFIELYNRIDTAIDMTGCRVQTNRSSAMYSLPAETLAPAAFRTIYITGTPLTLTKTTTGTVYILSSDGQTEVDSQGYSNLAADTSWARLDDGSWRQTYAPTPSATNTYQPYLPCDDGYVRNETTGRCNKIVVETALVDCGDGKYRSEETGRCRAVPAASVLAACKLGQYRSEDTNRCRNLVTATDTRKPCHDDQYRSEETGRCRLIASAAKEVTPCKENQERNPTTNRCRNVTKAVPAAAYAVQPVKQGAKAFIGWWALGGVGAAALGYAAWEWRSEVRRLVRRVGSVGRGKDG